jgi:hypothetical protein
MFLLGVKTDHDTATAFFVILEKQLKNVRNFYTVLEARQLPAAACQDEMTAFYHDTAYTIRKRVFSQDRRPKKDVSARPAVVLAAGRMDLPLIDALRKEDIPVEAVFAAGGSTDDRPGHTPNKAGIGRNHPASEQMMCATLIQVLEQNRLDLQADEPARPHQLMSEFKRLLEAFRRSPSVIHADVSPAPLVMALAAPIWFKENIRYATVYRTSATSIRKYK